MSYTTRREAVASKLKEHSALFLFSGIANHVSVDEYSEFEANRNFFYLTGLRRDHMILCMNTAFGRLQTTLFIEEADPTMERWYGRKVTVEEAKEITGIDDVRFLDSFTPYVERMITRGTLEHAYFDCYRESYEDLPDYNPVKAQEFCSKYPGITLEDCFPIIAKLRMTKEEEELTLIREAIQITNEALQNVMSNLTPGIAEYQAQADFEYMVKYNGADGMAFPTIAGSGANGTMLHYETNRDTCEDGTLLLLDLGAKYQGYCADITRTYPVNGTYTDRQRQVYNIVLKANRTVAEKAKPGMTLGQLNDICKKVLAEGCMELGLIQSEEEIGKYYMHGVSHHLGIDVHDVSVDTARELCPGAVITDEPGLYIDEWEIGIRIEDDLLITENGCECLSESIIRTAEEIEAFMKEQGVN